MANDTSREVLRELARFEQAFPCDAYCEALNEGPQEDCSRHGRNPRDLWDAIAEIQEMRDAAIKRAEAAEAEVERLRIQWDRSGKNDLIEQRDTYRDRWRQLMRDHEAVVKERDAAEAAHQALTDAVRGLSDEYRHDDARHLIDFGQHHPVAHVADRHLRAILDEHGAKNVVSPPDSDNHVGHPHWGPSTTGKAKP